LREVSEKALYISVQIGFSGGMRQPNLGGQEVELFGGLRIFKFMT
jgi:hypothetical protein